MPLFLTGPRGIGKSTALRRALAASGLRPGGIMTVFDAPRGSEEKRLWLLPWSPEPDYAAGAVCARMGPGGREVFPEVFDTLGVRLLEAAEGEESISPLVLDELGFLEIGAARFRETVLRLLRGPRPVLGVVRQGLGAWGDAPLGKLLELTEENREEVPARILEWLSQVGKTPLEGAEPY